MPSVCINGPLRARDHEKITDLSASTGLTASKIDKEVTGTGVWDRTRRCIEVLITVETADIRWTVDGTTPTVTAGTALGHIASSGDDITITGYDNIKAFRAINAVAASNAAIRITYFYQ